MEETLNTLNYAKRARNIKKKVYKNLKESPDESEVSKYKEQIKMLMQRIEFLNVSMNQPAFCEGCKKIIKGDKIVNFSKSALQREDNPSDEFFGFSKLKSNQ